MPPFVDHPDTMTPPVGTLGGRGTKLGCDHFDQALQDGEGQSLAGCAVGGGAKSPLSELDNMLTGRVAVEDLGEE